MFARLQRMGSLNPTWIDVTWGAGGTTSDSTLEICTVAQNKLGLETMMHLTCTNMPLEKFEIALKTAKENGISNILALRGGVFQASLFSVVDNNEQILPGVKSGRKWMQPLSMLLILFATFVSIMEITLGLWLQVIQKGIQIVPLMKMIYST